MHTKMTTHSKVLIVTPNSQRLEELGKMLTEELYEVSCSCSTQEAETMINQVHPDLVLCDLSENHISMAKWLVTVAKLVHRSHFVLLAPHNMTSEIMFLGVGKRITLLSLPIEPGELVQNIRRLLTHEDSKVNRREHNRYRLYLDTHIIMINPFSNEESRPVPIMVRDISRSGVSLIVRQLLPVPSMLKLIIHLSDQTRPMSMMAKSLTCTLTQIQGVYRLGAKFVGLLPPQLDETIEAFARMHPGQSHDIFMGKSFRQAVNEWLESHRSDLNQYINEQHHPMSILKAELFDGEKDLDDTDFGALGGDRHDNRSPCKSNGKHPPGTARVHPAPGADSRDLSMDETQAARSASNFDDVADDAAEAGF